MKTATAIAWLLLVGCTSEGFQQRTRFEWKAPLTSADGTALVDLAGYRVYIEGPHGLEVHDSTLPVLFVHLTRGRYLVYVTAYDNSLNESEPSKTLVIDV